MPAAPNAVPAEPRPRTGPLAAPIESARLAILAADMAEVDRRPAREPRTPTSR